MRMGRLIAMAAVAVAAFQVAHADEVPYWSDTPVTCHWIGKVRTGYTSASDYSDGYMPMPQMGYAQWTNQSNWAEGIVPGRFLVMHEDGTGTTNGCVGCTAVFDGNCTISCIQLTGMVSISNILVTGSTAPRFYFGHWRWDNPHLFIEQGGSFRITADVPEAPYVIPLLRIRDVTHTGLSLTLENNSPGAFCMGYIGHVEPAISGWLGQLDIRIEGSGEIKKRETTYSSGWQPVYIMAQTGGTYVSVSPETPINHADRAVQINVVDTGYTQQMEIPQGKMFNLEDNPGIVARGDMTISGEGTLYLSKKDAVPAFRIAPGKTVEVSATIVRRPDAQAEHSGLSLGAVTGYTGTMRLTGTNTFPGVVSVLNGATLEVPSVGLGDVGSPVGKKGVTLGSYAFFRYTGSGETTDRSLSGAGYGTVIMAGTGDLVWKGEISGGTTYHYTITNESPTARFVCATSTITKSIQIVKGTRLGFAKPDDSDAIAMDKLVMDGDASVEVGDGVTVTLAAFSRTQGTLAVTLTGSGKLIFPGVSEGPAPDWLKVNGSTAWYGADGSVYALDSLANSRMIAAHGDTVPDAPGEAVGITTEGTGGNDTLAAATTRVRVLNHEVAVPATIDMSAGQTLQANLIRVKSGAGDLTIGTAAGMGSVTAAEGSFAVQAEDASATLTVNAAVDVPAAVPIAVQGAGTNVFAAFNGYSGKLSLDGGTVLLTNTVNVTAAMLRGTGAFDFANEELKLTGSDVDGVEAEFAAAGPVNIGVMNGKLKMSGAQNLTVGTLEVGGDGGEVVLNGPVLTANGVSADMDNATQPEVSIVVGTNGTGVLRLESGAVTGRLALAIYDSARVKGAVYQTGGEFVNVTKDGETTVMGLHGYAYYGLYGGRYVAAGDWYLSNNGEGILDITGGELWHTPASVHKSRARLGGWVGNAAVRISGTGVFNATNVTTETILPGYGRQDSSASLTVENGGKFLQLDKSINIGRGYGTVPCHAVVNINAGGTVRASSIVRSSSSVYPSDEWPEGTCSDARYTNMYACVNCNGGTFVNTAWGAIFGEPTTSWAYPPNRVTLYEGGLTVDTGGKDCKLNPRGGLQAPSGQGVVSIPWNAETDGKGYVGSPLVMIDGDGKGATAWADFDHEAGTVTGIRVTSPGNDYTYANAKIIMNKVAIKTIPCVLGVVKSGGLTKSGSGTLTLNATNTYTGATTVKKGTLKLGYDDVISSASELVLDGGTLDMNNKAQTFANVRATTNGGTVVNGTLTLSGLFLDFDDILAGKVQNIGTAIAFAPGAQLVVANVDKATRPPSRYLLATFSDDISASNLVISSETLENLPPRWKIDVERRRIMLRYPRGATLNFR